MSAACLFHGVVCLHFAWCGRDVSVHDGVGGKLLGCVRDGVVVAPCPRCSVAFLSTRGQLCESVVQVNTVVLLCCVVMTLFDVEDFTDDSAGRIDDGRND